MSATFTPEPWTLQTARTSVGVCHKIGPFPRDRKRPDLAPTFACVYEDGMSKQVELARGTLDTELLANARLICASPDLYASLREFVALYDGTRDVIGQSVKDKLTRAEAALAKADGVEVPA